MSQINTNGINVNYPVPGENNSSQGFRDNFGQIRTNLNTAATEITDLQNKVVLKAALDNSVLNNDMANAQISNCSTRGFRGTTFNLGNALAGTVLVDVNKADVHYGTVTGNVTLQFGSWAPTNTESEVTLRLAVANVDAVISLPSQVVSANNNFGTTLLENYNMIGNTATITAPANTQVLEFTFTSLDCGNTISVTPTNRSFQSTQIVTRTPPPTGLPGDVAGTTSVDANYVYVCTDPFDSQLVPRVASNAYTVGNIVTLNNVTNVELNAPIIFTGTVFGGIEANTVYYVKSKPGNSNITLSSTGFDGTAGPEFEITSNANGNMVATTINGNSIWKRVDLTGGGAIPAGNISVTGNLEVADSTTIGGDLVVGGTLQGDGGLLTNLSIGGNLFTANYFQGDGSLLTNLSVGAGTYISNGISTVDIPIESGNIILAANGNTSLTVSEFGSTSYGVFEVSGNLSVPVSQLNVTGGTNGYFLQTDGAGNLVWTPGTVTPPDFGAGGSNTQIQFNDGGAPSGAVGFTFDKVTQLTSLPGNLNVTDNVSASNISAALFVGNLSSTGNSNIGNLGFGTGVITGTGNITAGNFIGVLANGVSSIDIPVLDGNINMSVNSNANIVVITDVGANIDGTLEVTGNVNVGNLETTGLITTTGNVLGSNVLATMSLTSNGTAGIGYATGAGGSITQAGSRSTGVTLDVPTGSITLVSAPGSTAWQSFTVTNSTVAGTDIIVINQKSGTDWYQTQITEVANGSFRVTFRTTGGTTTEQPIFNFAVIKGVDA